MSHGNRHVYKPMLAKVAPDAFTDKDWIFEIKWDGFRAIAYVNGDWSLKSRNEKELKNNFPELAELTKVAAGLVLDGEIVIMREGVPDFQTLLERGQAVSKGEIERQMERTCAEYVVFDVLEKDGKPLTGLPLMERKQILKDSLKEGTHIILSDFIDEKGEAYFKLILERGLEGVMAKRKNSPYEEGLRTGDWLKIKKIKTCDCVIFGYTLGEGAMGKAFGALVVGLYDGGKPVFVGKVGTGFTERTLHLLMDKFGKIVTDQAPFQVENMGRVTWVEPRLVCEVGYQVVTRDMRLRMPRFYRLREDKVPEECTIDQIMENKKMGKAVEEKLAEYKSKRSFEETPEPQGGEKKQESLIYVIQEHHARALHWDFRLEHNGVLASWAVPKGVPETTVQRHLAVQTEDHPYEYASFAGTIPKGQYGAGTVTIWDKGHYTPKIWEDDKIEVDLDGDRLKGRYILVRLKKAKEENAWLMLKGKD